MARRFGGGSGVSVFSAGQNSLRAYNKNSQKHGLPREQNAYFIPACNLNSCWLPPFPWAELHSELKCAKLCNEVQAHVLRH